MTLRLDVPPAPAEQWSQAAGRNQLRGALIDEDQVAEVIGLHRRVLEQLAPGTLAAETDAFFAGHIRRDGRILGLWTNDGQLVAYAVLGLPSADSDYNFGSHVDFLRGQLGLVGHLDGVAVDPRFRGLGLQRALSARRVALALSHGRRHLLTTVAPWNMYSLRNCLALGFRVVRTQPMFAERHMRHLMYRDVFDDGIQLRPPVLSADSIR